jgi:nucleoside-diphosphate-sugar epimerase
MSSKFNNVVIFGGTGFIGTFFANFLLDRNLCSHIYLCDIETLDQKSSNYRKQSISNKKISYVELDVRKEINKLLDVDNIDLIANFAAIHREPGHEDFEYFQTNLLGAENVCRYADLIGCKHIIFTSSISPYGISEAVRDESSLPVPVTPYGSSKLVAEKIHQVWQAQNFHEKKLTIVRPGVVFGPGEGGNVSRLIQAVINRYFFYMGNKHTSKAGIYVKELCSAILWVYECQINNKSGVDIFNMTMNPGPSIEEYVKSICKVANINRNVIALPFPLLLFASKILDLAADILGVKNKFSPVRIRKLVRSNNILPTKLVEAGYKYVFSLDDAFEDWKNECPQEWEKRI